MGRNDSVIVISAQYYVLERTMGCVPRDKVMVVGEFLYTEEGGGKVLGR